MPDRGGLIGFSLGELGLLLTFAVIFMLGVTRRDTADMDTVESLEAQVDSLQKSIAASNATIDSLSSIVDSLQSSQTPSCQEKGIIDGYLFTATVLAPNRFRVNGETYESMTELLSGYSQAVTQADQIDCNHQIRVRPGATVGLEEYREGVKTLARQFYYSEI